MNDSWLGELGGDWYAQPFEVDGENKLIYEAEECGPFSSYEEAVSLAGDDSFFAHEPSTLGLESLFDSSTLDGMLSPTSPPRSCAFKASYSHRGPSPPPTPQGRSCQMPLKSAATPEDSADSSSSSPGRPKTEVCREEDLHLGVSYGEGSDSLYTINCQGSHSSRSSASMCKLESGSGMGGEPGSLESKPRASDLEVDSSDAVGVLDMDLRCKGEQLNLECEEDLGQAASLPNPLDWLCLPPQMPQCLDFIPVDNACHHDYLQSDVEPSYKCGEMSSDESENEAEGRDSPMSARRRTAMAALALARTHSSSSPGPSLPESVASQASAQQPEKQEEAPAKPIAAVPSTTSIVTSPSKPKPAVRRRPGRPSKPTAAASEAKAAGAVKRKRATTSKPAVPPVLGQACTQCSTHVTPVWRAGPEGPKTLCNACGVRYMKVAKKK